MDRLGAPVAKGDHVGMLLYFLTCDNFLLNFLSQVFGDYLCVTAPRKTLAGIYLLKSTGHRQTSHRHLIMDLTAQRMTHSVKARQLRAGA